jgi:hypothetical protein
MPADLDAGREPPPQFRLGPRSRQRLPGDADRRAGGLDLEAAPPRARPLAWRTVHVDHDVAEFGGQPGRAAVEPAAEQEAAADPRPERHEEGVLGAARGAEQVLGEQRDVRVVVDVHGQPEPLAHQVPERHASERQVRRPQRPPAALLDERGDPEADRLHVRRGRAHLLDGVDEDVERLPAIAAAPPAMHPMVHHEAAVHHAAEELRATGVDPDNAPWRHGRTIYRGV